MKNKFTITISDIKGSKNFTLNQIIKRFFLFFLLAIGLSVIIGAISISYLTHQITKLENTKLALQKDIVETTIKFENEAQEKLKYYEIITDKIDELETLIGIKPSVQQEYDFENRLKDISFTTLQQTVMLQFIPNGKVMEDNGISAKFGMRTHPILETKEFHKGIDLRANIGTPIYAPADGVVEFAGTHSENSLGALVIIDHVFGFKTYYAHLSKKMIVKHGEYVKKGDLIAHSGNTGLSTGPHLHYEVRFLIRPLDPINFINWDNTNFIQIFKEEKNVPWDSLVKATIQLVNKIQK